MGAGAGDRQGVETPWLLVSAQKGAQNKTNHRKTPRDGEAQEQVRRKHNGGVKEVRYWRLDPPRDQQGTGCSLRPAEEGGWFKEMVEEGQNLEGSTHTSSQGRYQR